MMRRRQEKPIERHEPPVDFDVRGLIENSLLEWENHVAAVVIAGGCNLRCPYCHSWRYVTGLDDLVPIGTERVFSLLERQRGWIDGVVFTGGEPTLQKGLADMLRRTREYGVRTKLHTNGTNPGVITALLAEGLVDCLALDYKAPLDSAFFAAAGIAERQEVLEAVRDSFRLAREAGVEREYHTTLNPNFVTAESLARMGRELEPEGVWILQQYEAEDCLNAAAAGGRRYSAKEFDALAATAQDAHQDVLLKKGRSA